MPVELPEKQESEATVRSVLGLPWYPMLIAAAFVLNLWVATGVSALSMTRSLAAAVVGTGAVLIVVAVLSRRVHVGGAAALLVFAVAASRGAAYLAGLVVLAVAIPLAFVLWGRIRNHRPTWPGVTRALNLFGSLILLVVVVGGVFQGAVPSLVTDLQQGNGSLDGAAGEAGESAGPDVYILLLDGYPRADWLDQLFGGDNASFRSALEDRGFTIAERSTSNYMFTQLTLASMLHMRPVTEIEALVPVFAGRVSGHPLLRNTINSNPVFEEFRSRGYRVVTSSPGYEHVALRRSDVYLDDGQLNDFEYELLRSTFLERVLLAVDPGLFADQKRDRVRSGFSHFATLTADDGMPTFAIVHLPAPHLPVVFDADGGDAALPASGNIYGREDADLLPTDAYVEQLAFVNAETIRAVDGVLGRRTGAEAPVIIVMSDHGAERRPQVFEGDGTPGHYANFFASLTPGAAGLFPDDASPVNVFPRIFNHYFGTELPEWPDERYPWIPSP